MGESFPHSKKALAYKALRSLFPDERIGRERVIELKLDPNSVSAAKTRSVALKPIAETIAVTVMLKHSAN